VTRTSIKIDSEPAWVNWGHIKGWETKYGKLIDLATIFEMKAWVLRYEQEHHTEDDDSSHIKSL
jgi:hypothetical protein